MFPSLILMQLQHMCFALGTAPNAPTPSHVPPRPRPRFIIGPVHIQSYDEKLSWQNAVAPIRELTGYPGFPQPLFCCFSQLGALLHFFASLPSLPAVALLRPCLVWKITCCRGKLGKAGSTHNYSLVAVNFSRKKRTAFYLHNAKNRKRKLLSLELRWLNLLRGGEGCGVQTGALLLSERDEREGREVGEEDEEEEEDQAEGPCEPPCLTYCGCQRWVPPQL